METRKQNNAEPEFEIPGMAAHEPQVDLARNKNLFKKSLYFAGGFVALLLIMLVWQWFGNSRHNNNVAEADLAYLTATDSTTVAQSFEMYKQVADAAGYKANERAQLMTAAKLYQEGNYEEALEYLDKPGVESPVIATGILCLKGDCYANLDKNDEAVEQYEKALAQADNNAELTPYVLRKLANLYHVKADYTKEAETLKQLQSDFPAYNTNVDIEAEIARAEALAGQK